MYNKVKPMSFPILMVERSRVIMIGSWIQKERVMERALYNWCLKCYGPT
jgi:hypothetical protein